METGSETERVMEKSPLIFTIIGGGLTGTSMLCQFVAASHPFLVDARGQSRFYDRNPQALAVNLLQSGTVQIEPVALEAGEEKMKTERAAKAPLNGTGSLWVDPFTHRVQRMGINGRVIKSDSIYAVGAMTRGQIIDASMAHGSAVSTQTIALDWADQIFSDRVNP